MHYSRAVRGDRRPLLPGLWTLDWRHRGSSGSSAGPVGFNVWSCSGWPNFIMCLAVGARREHWGGLLAVALSGAAGAFLAPIAAGAGVGLARYRPDDLHVVSGD